ncbi:MAG: hypothetical protein Q8K72_04565, partial [Acidimicrobiales bacterium]|nr:hypothetical protein [Acidimicrobiales bacterium]
MRVANDTLSEALSGTEVDADLALPGQGRGSPRAGWSEPHSSYRYPSIALQALVERLDRGREIIESSGRLQVLGDPGSVVGLLLTEPRETPSQPVL